VTQPRIAVFARSANGNAAPTRIIDGQATKLGRTVHGIAYDPIHDEIVVPNPLAGAILVFRAAATGAEAPIRVIQGARTCLSTPHSVSIDTTHQEILVGDLSSGAVLVFPWNANGDLPPLRKISGPKTRLGHVVGLGVDPAKDLLVVANSDEIVTFNRTDDGDVAPRSIIRGPKSGIGEEPWQLQLHQGRIFVAASNHLHQWVYPSGQIKPAPHSVSVPHDPWNDPAQGFVGVWNIFDNGDVPPLGMLKQGLRHPSGLALDIENREVFVSDSVDNSVRAFHVPEFFKKSGRR
jgi:DNA-binding beta-propeller fold protein YncE